MAARRQKTHCHVDQLGDLADGHLWRAKDGRLRIALVSPEGLLTATFEGGSKLNRAVSYFDRACKSISASSFEHVSSSLTVGYQDGTVEIFTNATLGGFSRLAEWKVELGPRVTFERIAWLDPRTLIFVGSGLEETSFHLWDAQEGKQLFEHRVERFSRHLQRIYQVPNHLFWLDSGTLHSSKPDFISIDSIVDAFPFAINELLLIKKDGEWLRLRSDGSIETLKIPGKSPFVKGYAHSTDACTRMLYVDEEGWQWLVISRPESEHEFIRFQQGLHESEIADVYFGQAVLIILRVGILAVHDTTSMRLLLWQPVAQQKKQEAREQGEGQRTCKRLLHVIEEDGLILLQWGPRNVQVWNYGRAMACLQEPTRSLSKGTGRKSSLTQLVRNEYAEWRAEQDEQAEMERLRCRHNPAGLSEEELLAMALSLSMADGVLSSSSTSSFQEISTDDEELRRVLEMSRYDI